MRTRLDEILDDELAHAPGGEARMTMPYGAVKRALERAFRHGVEQSVEATRIISGHNFDTNGLGLAQIILLGVEAAQKQIKNVQPAPAGEKRCCPWGAPGDPCSAHSHCGESDRRKGERREGLEKRHLILPELPGETTPIFQHNSNMFWRIDRRSGKERRKPFLRCVEYRCFKPFNHAGPHDEVHSW